MLKTELSSWFLKVIRLELKSCSETEEVTFTNQPSTKYLSHIGLKSLSILLCGPVRSILHLTDVVRTPNFRPLFCTIFNAYPCTTKLSTTLQLETVISLFIPLKLCLSLVPIFCGSALIAFIYLSSPTSC